MGMAPNEFFMSFVLGNYWDFQDEPGCVRRGFNAAVAASHIADHCWEYLKRHDPAKLSRFRNKKDYLEHVSARTGGFFWDIRSVANAFKHLYARSEASVASGGAIEAVTFLPGDVTEVTCEPTVMYTRKTGERFELLPILKKVVDFWSGEI